MRAEPGGPLRIALQDAGEHLAGVPEAFVALFKRGDLSVVAAMSCSLSDAWQKRCARRQLFG
jgi:hypothetical protein